MLQKFGCRWDISSDQLARTSELQLSGAPQGGAYLDRIYALGRHAQVIDRISKDRFRKKIDVPAARTRLAARVIGQRFATGPAGVI